MRYVMVVQCTQLELIRLWYLWFDKPEIDSWTLFHRIDTNSFPVCRFDIPEVDSHETWYSRSGLRVGWKCCRFESIQLNQHESYESTEVCGHVLRTRKVHVSLFHGSWLPVGYAGWVENVDTNHFPCCRFVMLEVDLWDATPCESSWDVTCESSQIIKCLRRIDSLWVYWTWRRASKQFFLYSADT